MIKSVQLKESAEVALQKSLKETSDYKHALEELKTVQESLLFHIENTSFGFIEWDNQLHMKSLSKRAEEIFGWSLNEFLESQRTGYSNILEEDLPMLIKIAADLVSGAVENNSIQHRNVTKNGKVIWCEWFNSVLKDKDGKVSAIMSLVQDITQRKLAEQNLTKSERRLNEAQAIAHLGSWELNFTTGKALWSDEACRIYKLTPEEKIAQTFESWISYVHPEDLNYTMAAINESQKTLSNTILIHRIVLKDGTIKYLEGESRFECDENGKPIGMYGVVLDVTEKRIAEENVTQRENHFRSLIEKGSDMIALRSLEGILLYLSPSYTHVLGYSNEELLATCVFNYIHPHDLPDLLDQTQVILKTPGSYFFRQQRFLHKNGTWIWCEGTITNMLHEPGVNALVSNFRDISGKKLAELNQIESEAQIQAIYAASLDAVIIIDEKGIITKWDAKSEALFGWKEKEVAGLKLSEIIIPPRYREMHNKGINHYLKTGEGPVLNRTIDITALKKSGVEFDVSLSITASQINTKQHFIGFIRDISDKKTAEQQREFHKNNLNALINNTNDLMWSVDKDTRLITFNQPFYEVIKFVSGKELAKGDDVFSVALSPEQHGRFKISYSRALAGETFTEIEHIEKPVESWSEISYYPIRKGDEIIGTACHSRDITARKLAELERGEITRDLIQRNKDLEQFAYIVSHNLRAPVANILGTSGELNEPGLSAEDKDALSGGLHESVVKLDNVVKDLSQILQVKREISEAKENVCFSTLVGNIKISIKNLIEHDAIEIKCDFSEVDEYLTVKSYLHSIFYNLISNSIKYRQQEIPCVIEIKSHRIKNKTELIFTDNGMGIDLQKRGDQVFGLYKRFHVNIEGKGMGLFMVKTQVETLGGRISIKSEVNKGTEFRIEFQE